MPRQRSQVEVSMFPFLSVLCTVIGVLVLFIVLILSTRVVQQEEMYQEDLAYEQEPSPGEPDAVEQGIDPQVYEQLEEELDNLRKRLTRRQIERDRLKRKLTGLEDLLDYKKTQSLVPTTTVRGVEVAVQKPVQVVEASGDGWQTKLRPILVECRRDGYTMYPSRDVYTPVTRTISDNKLKFDIAADLKKFLTLVDRKKQREYLVFLVHPNGVETFHSLRIYVDQNHPKVNVGWEPFSPDWIVVNDQLQELLDRKEKSSGNGAEETP